MALTLDTLRQSLPTGWAAAIPSGGTWGIGYDVATSDRTTSNPSAIVARQQIGSRGIEWLVLTWKTRDPDASLLIAHTVASDLCAAGHRPRRLCVDDSNEKFHARELKKKLRGLCLVTGIAGNAVLKYAGEEFQAKHLLGTLYVKDHDDTLLWTPRAEWIKQDRSLVKYFAGSFTADIDAKGRHGDTFDAGKLAKWACIGRTGGSSEAASPPDNSPSSPSRRDARATGLHPSVRPRVARHAV